MTPGLNLYISDIIIQLWFNTLLTTAAAVIQAQIKNHIWLKTVLQSLLHMQGDISGGRNTNTWGPAIYRLTGKLPVGSSFYKSSWQFTQRFFFQHEAHLRLHVRIGNVYLHSRWKSNLHCTVQTLRFVHFPNCHSGLIIFANQISISKLPSPS